MGIGSQGCRDLSLNSPSIVRKPCFISGQPGCNFESDQADARANHFSSNTNRSAALLVWSTTEAGGFQTTHRDRAIAQLQNCFLV